MAFDAEDIARLKARVPDAHQPPRDAGGTLSNGFSSVDSRSESTALQGSEIDRFNLGVAFINNPDEDAANPNFRLNGAQAKVHALRIEQHQREEHDDLDTKLALMLSAELDRQLARLNAELAAIDARLEEIRQRREAIGTQMDALDDLDQLARAGKLDPHNPAHRALLLKAGIDPDKLEGRSITDLIAQRRRDLTAEDGALETEWNEKMKRRGQVVIEQGAVIAAQNEIERADSDEARVLAERRARTVLGAQQLGEAATWTRSQQAKVIAADAVTVNETTERQADSHVLNRTAVDDNTLFMDQKGAQFELDDGGGAKPPAPPKPR